MFLLVSCFFFSPILVYSSDFSIICSMVLFSAVSMISAQVLPLVLFSISLFLAHLESAYSLIWDVHDIWGQGGETLVLIISRPIQQSSDWWKFRFWNGVMGNL